MIATQPVFIQQNPSVRVALDSGTATATRSTAIGPPIPDPGKYLYVHADALVQYKQMVAYLEEQLENSRILIEQLVSKAGYEPAADLPHELSAPLDAASVAVVNSLLCSVPESNYYRDDDES